jgi:uncharacterized protein YjbI with pentapeptide repeats
LRAQDEALQKYLDQMSDLLINQDLRLRPKEHVRDLAKARTIATLLGLDSAHKKRPLKLVYELGLAGRGNSLLDLRNASLDGADLSELTLREADLECIDLRVSNLKGADLEGSNLRLADLRGSDLRRADLKGVDFTETNLLPYDTRDPERWSLHNLEKTNDLGKNTRCPRRLKIARRLGLGGVWHTFRKLTWRDGRPTITKLTITNLKGATLAGTFLYKTFLSSADLINADLKSAVLKDTDLKDADLTGADLTGADLTGADLTGAILKGASLTEANLRRTTLKKADLNETILIGANLSGANLDGAYLSKANVSKANLYGAKGLTNEDLKRQTSALEGATMPNGEKYENWLKSKGREEDGENSGPS